MLGMENTVAGVSVVGLVHLFEQVHVITTYLILHLEFPFTIVHSQFPAFRVRFADSDGAIGDPEKRDIISPRPLLFHTSLNQYLRSVSRSVFQSRPETEIRLD